MFSVASTANTEEYMTGPHHLITAEQVEAALKADAGEDAKLISWDVKDFVKKGMNFCFYVTSIQVRYSIHEKNHITSYVVKMNPLRDIADVDVMITMSSMCEGEFYRNIGPKMNDALTSAGLAPLSTPKCFYESRDKGREILILEDLRQREFKTRDLSQPADIDHAMIVIEALAKFHAASFLVIKKYPEDAFSKLEFFGKDVTPNEQQKICEILNKVVDNGILFSRAVLEECEGYEKVRNWIAKHGDNPAQVWVEMSSRSQVCDVLCHGDLNANNMLFRYDESGNPVEVMFIDMQAASLSSSAKDITNYFFMSNMDSIRKANRERFLSLYYEKFCATVESGGGNVTFTYEDFCSEFKSKQDFGMLLTMLFAPYMITGLTTPEELFGSNTKEEQEIRIKEQLKLLDFKSGKKPQLLSTFDELFEYGDFK